jgi:hypothetical protein
MGRGVGHVISKGIVIDFFNSDEQNGYLKKKIGRFWGKRGAEEA